MAIEKEYENDSGITGNYWSIKSINVDKFNKNSSVTICLHKDENTKKVAHKMPIGGCDKYYSWNGDNFPFSTEALAAKDPYAIAYEKILAEDYFFGATPPSPPPEENT